MSRERLLAELGYDPNASPKEVLEDLHRKGVRGHPHPRFRPRKDWEHDSPLKRKGPCRRP